MTAKAVPDVVFVIRIFAAGIDASIEVFSRSPCLSNNRYPKEIRANPTAMIASLYANAYTINATSRDIPADLLVL